MDMDWHKEFIKMPQRMAKDCYMSPQDTIAVQRSIRIFLMREKSSKLADVQLCNICAIFRDI